MCEESFKKKAMTQTVSGFSYCSSSTASARAVLGGAVIATSKFSICIESSLPKQRVNVQQDSTYIEVSKQSESVSWLPPDLDLASIAL
jgi:hypothetical protein